MEKWTETITPMTYQHQQKYNHTENGRSFALNLTCHQTHFSFSVSWHQAGSFTLPSKIDDDIYKGLSQHKVCGILTYCSTVHCYACGTDECWFTQRLQLHNTELLSYISGGQRCVWSRLPHTICVPGSRSGKWVMTDDEKFRDDFLNFLW